MLAILSTKHSRSNRLQCIQGKVTESPESKSQTFQYKLMFIEHLVLATDCWQYVGTPRLTSSSQQSSCKWSSRTPGRLSRICKVIELIKVKKRFEPRQSTSTVSLFNLCALQPLHRQDPFSLKFYFSSKVDVNRHMLALATVRNPNRHWEK